MALIKSALKSGIGSATMVKGSYPSSLNGDCYISITIDLYDNTNQWSNHKPTYSASSGTLTVVDSSVGSRVSTDMSLACTTLLHLTGATNATITSSTPATNTDFLNPVCVIYE